MRREAVPESMGANRFRDPGLPGGLTHCFLQTALVNVMATNDSGRAGVLREAVRGEDVLPAPLFMRVRILALQSKGQVDSRRAVWP